MPVRWRYRVEYILLRALSGALQVLPLRLSLCIAAGLAALVYRACPKRPAEARRRIAQVFPEKSPEEVDAIAYIGLRNLFFSAIETIKFPRFGARWIARHIDVGNFPERVEAHLKPGRGALFVIPHMGNWELAGLTAGRRGLKMFFLTGRQRNPLAEAYLNRVRAATGLEYIPRDEKAVRTVLRNLQAGKIFGILPDVRMKTPGVPVKLFGYDAELPGGVALFARRTGVPIFLGHVRRVGWSHHIWAFEQPIWSDPASDSDRDAARISRCIADYFTEVVRSHPEQYFWYNKRWVLEPRSKA